MYGLQGDVSYLINAEPGSHAAHFIREHGFCAPSMDGVVDAQHAFDHAVKNGAEPYTGDMESRCKHLQSLELAVTDLFF